MEASGSVKGSSPETHVPRRPRGEVAAFLRRVVAFLAISAGISASGAAIVRRWTPIGEFRNPRARLLWDSEKDDSSIVLLGDSAFASCYIDRPEQALWNRLAHYQGRKVFPGALNGAKPADLVDGAHVVRATWKPGTVVLLDVIPTRGALAEVTASHRAYAHQFGELRTARGATNWIERAPREAEKLFFPLSSPETVAEVLNSGLRRPRWFSPGDDKDWVRAEEFARNRYTLFLSQANLAFHGTWDWLGDMSAILREGNACFGLVLLPWNEALIRRYSAPQEADAVVAAFRRGYVELKADPALHGVPMLDLSGSVPSGCFADLVHPTACGDDIIAQNIDEWLRAKPFGAGACGAVTFSLRQE